MENNLSRILEISFNLSTSEKTSVERVTGAELRFCTQVTSSNKMGTGVSRDIKVSVLEENRKRTLKKRMIYGGSVNGQRKWHSFVLPAICVQKESVILQIQMERSIGEANLDIELFEERARPHLVLYSIDNSGFGNLDDELNFILQNSISQSMQPVIDKDLKSKEDIIEEKFERIKASISENESIRTKRETLDCSLRPMRVNFRDIGWNFMIKPIAYEANKCVGVCKLPFSSFSSHTKHAIVQASHKTLSWSSTDWPCCVPIQLDPLSVLYYDRRNIPTFRYSYDGMVARKCGCR
ncbi:DgyrCDS4377 [Dimorphilus gyrociliatus]|uniref:DgyrCDS4377 n=1 Tax=Dimorphilus gyrociliatus TaxID=2664684 RepID=A0A7I8VJ26_9ANNE|nr:DgyrCDS4377 [Dimorphilus gyrociliatus]